MTRRKPVWKRAAYGSLLAALMTLSISCADPPGTWFGDLEGWREGNPSYDEFTEDMLLASCDKMQECEMLSEYFTYEDCLALGDRVDTGEEFVCEDYDVAAAIECLAAQQQASCEEFPTSGDWNAVCNEVCSND